ncbi:hypothetical protein [Stratiformator vulcanicus]|uniref:Glycosyl hydrolases family 2, sugar binding domain n=1 Tax=Stratiformator vulcanicus TaxID=2527980 RepID=A0A517QXY5_9PLAN|nr:hypothetical protein [Stratiformator vulcanicus]QDT36516.1 hypothetical protein Pan189_08740 [Stratiformator vulcanicus]
MGRSLAYCAMFGCLLVCRPGADTSADEPVGSTVKESLRTVRAVDHFGEGNAAAREAVDRLGKLPASQLASVLHAFKDANPIARNYLRNAAEQIFTRERDQISLDELVRFAADTSQDPQARKMVVEWVREESPTRADELIDRFLSDPSGELRRDAVARRVDRAENLLEQEQFDLARDVYQEALGGAVHEDQVKAIVAALGDLDVEVDIAEHLGLLREWQVIGPFDNTDTGGFDVAYPPESKFEPTASYAGKLGEVRWQPIETDDDFGVVDIAKSFENWKGSAVYLTTTFDSSENRRAQLRLGTANAYKIWVNGEFVFGREEYHRGKRLDQYLVPIDLVRGENRFLIKLLQNEQTQDWAQAYTVQVRVTDGAGAAIRPAQ